MEYRTLGSTGLAVSRMAFGAMTFTQGNQDIGAIDLQLAPEDLAALDEATLLPPVYPNWFIERLVDEPMRQALSPK